MSGGQNCARGTKTCNSSGQTRNYRDTTGRNGMNIGIFGGRFDPIHRGHLSLATAAADRYSLARVLFVPVNVPPHKERADVTAFAHRYAMVALATEEEKRFVPSLLEGPTLGLDSAAPDAKARAGRKGSAIGPANYSIDTVRRL